MWNCGRRHGLELVVVPQQEFGKLGCWSWVALGIEEAAGEEREQQHQGCGCDCQREQLVLGLG